MQPPDPLELWESPPFEPEIRGEYLYGRGVADDKGQLYMLLSAARELARAGELPVNVRFACDGEEETGGHSIVEFLEADERGADAAVIFDSGMIARDRPAFNIATRGMAYFHLTLRTGERDLHSGIYGGAALNAAHALIADARRGRRVRRAAGRAAAPGDHATDRGGARGLARAACRRRGARRPGRAPGRPVGRRGVLPAHVRRAVARRQRDRDRVAAAREDGAPGARRSRTCRSGSRRASRSRRSRRRSRACSTRRPRSGAELDVELLSDGAPGLVPPDATAIRLGLDAFERALGVRPPLIRSGGSLPIVAAFADKRIPTVITGFALPDSNIHSPNERLLADYVPRGIAAARALFEEFAAL